VTRIRTVGQKRRRRRAERRRAEDRIPLPKRPYRDSALFYGILAIVLIAVAFATAGNIVRALIFGAGFFLIATAWSWWRFHQKLVRQHVEERRAATGRHAR
jgi:predicted tellurium resistance membrane protein TerC